MTLLFVCLTIAVIGAFVVGFATHDSDKGVNWLLIWFGVSAIVLIVLLVISFTVVVKFENYPTLVSDTKISVVLLQNENATATNMEQLYIVPNLRGGFDLMKLQDQSFVLFENQIDQIVFQSDELYLEKIVRFRPADFFHFGNKKTKMILNLPEKTFQ